MMMILTLAIACITASVDQFIKHLIRRIPTGIILFQADSLFQITHCTNTGAAFSLLSGNPKLLALLSIALLFAVTLVVHRYMHLSCAGRISYAVLLGGGVGNLIDRLFYGGVTDYIRLLFISFPVFNLADVAITLSVIVMILLILTGKMDIHTGEDHGASH